uniref:Uncharacterized protein n=1 Tax=Anguilla anguilla TaxID=7936 RepID=A0A0E9UKV7_ANGAN
MYDFLSFCRPPSAHESKLTSQLFRCTKSQNEIPSERAALFCLHHDRGPSLLFKIPTGELIC